ncbi:hypothetical protein M2368_003072 [Arthrobacter sp. JUb119]|nr:hypothetical protein [Arthrobacter sp. JUb119]
MSKTIPIPMPPHKQSNLPEPPEVPAITTDSVQPVTSAYDWWTLALDFIASVAWPLLIFAALGALLFPGIRRVLSTGLAAVAKTFKSFKFGSVEAVLHDEQIQETLRQNEATLGISEESNRRVSKIDQSRDYSSRLHFYPVSFRETSDPRIIALESYNQLESFVVEALDELDGLEPYDARSPDNKKYYGSHRPRQMVQLLSELAERELLTLPEQDSINSLRRIRNDIAHNTAAVEMNLDTALAYRKQCEKIIRAIARRVDWKKDNGTGS